MKKITFFLLFCLAFDANASTSITTSGVSGHWTITGSPYLIFNDIGIAPGASLTIDPGVVLTFQGQYTMYVGGILHAAGTASQPIIFKIQDTTGWYLSTSTAGGWNQLYFDTTSGSDTSTINYCNFQDNSGQGIRIFGSLKIKNCNFFHCKNSTLLTASSLDSSFHLEMDSCNFYNTYSTNNGIFVTNNLGGSSYIHNSKFHNNTYTGCLFHGDHMNFIFENNEVYQNTQSATGFGSAVYIYTSNGIIKGNKIYSNTCSWDGTLSCWGGTMDIVGNYICNNNATTISGTCGSTQGGGGLRISGNSAPAFFTVRNNIIANNFAGIYGGGIYVFWTSAIIANNQIINNTGNAGGGIYMFNNVATSGNTLVKIKNNVFYNNISTIMLPTDTMNLWVGSADSFEYTNNWTQRPFYHDFYNAGFSYYLTGDTGTNIIGTSPGLIAPTITPNVTESALSANFNLLPTSPCIDKGDTSGASPYSVDYAGNIRIFGSRIDIGAYEYNPTEFATLNTNFISQPTKSLLIYPNPATSIIFFSTPEQKGTIELQDISGKQVAIKQVTNTLTSFDIHTLPRGIYFAVWNDGNGAKSVQKVVME